MDEGAPRFQNHEDCRTLTGLTLQQLPRDRFLGNLRRYPKHSFIWTADAADHSLYFLERGQVVIMINDAAGCEVIVRVIEPGQPFGELCFCWERNLPHGNCSQAAIDSDVWRIEFDDFMTYLRQDPEALLEFTFTFCERLADAERRIEVLSYRGAEARLGRLLLQLAETRGIENSERRDLARLPLGHDELARLAAMSRPHVTVTMNKLRKRGLVHYDRANQLTVEVALLREYINNQAGGP